MYNTYICGMFEHMLWKTFIRWSITGYLTGFCISYYTFIIGTGNVCIYMWIYKEMFFLFLIWSPFIYRMWPIKISFILKRPLSFFWHFTIEIEILVSMYKAYSEPTENRTKVPIQPNNRISENWTRTHTESSAKTCLMVGQISLPVQC